MTFYIHVESTAVEHSRIASTSEFDALMSALKDMERDSGIIMSNSPTQKVGAPVLSELEPPPPKPP